MPSARSRSLAPTTLRSDKINPYRSRKVSGAPTGLIISLDQQPQSQDHQRKHHPRSTHGRFRAYLGCTPSWPIPAPSPRPSWSPWPASSRSPTPAPSSATPSSPCAGSTPLRSAAATATPTLPASPATSRCCAGSTGRPGPTTSAHLGRGSAAGRRVRGRRRRRRPCGADRHRAHLGPRSLLLRPRPPTEGPQAGPGASPGAPAPTVHGQQEPGQGAEGLSVDLRRCSSDGCVGF